MRNTIGYITQSVRALQGASPTFVQVCVALGTHIHLDPNLAGRSFEGFRCSFRLDRHRDRRRAQFSVGAIGDQTALADERQGDAWVG